MRYYNYFKLILDYTSLIFKPHILYIIILFNWIFLIINLLTVYFSLEYLYDLSGGLKFWILYNNYDKNFSHCYYRFYDFLLSEMIIGIKFGSFIFYMWKDWFIPDYWFLLILDVVFVILFIRYFLTNISDNFICTSDLTFVIIKDYFNDFIILEFFSLKYLIILSWFFFFNFLICIFFVNFYELEVLKRFGIFFFN